jgi:hypothetical protein
MVVLCVLLAQMVVGVPLLHCVLLQMLLVQCLEFLLLACTGAASQMCIHSNGDQVTMATLDL